MCAFASLQLVLKAGDAKLFVRGSLLGEHQDASLLLTDFPMTTLRPIFRCLPQLACCTKPWLWSCCHTSFLKVPCDECPSNSLMLQGHPRAATRGTCCPR